MINIERNYMSIIDENNSKKSLTSLIFDKIRDDILNDRYKLGDKLVESKLADELRVSRTPVREALKQLELDGLVESIPNRGVIVKGLTDQDIYDIYSVRVSIESIAAELAVERMSESELKELEDIIDLMEFFTMKNDANKIFELNTQFHEKIYSCTKSRYLEHMLKDFQIFIKSTRLESLKTEGRLPTAMIEHKMILEAFKNRDKEEAKKCITQHIKSAQKNVNEMFLRKYKDK
ncbi:MAG: GntR family transcriptional regulator [Bacillota bacterium]|nr:GntR family transcriptional regulator [Bacillota bacterium]